MAARKKAAPKGAIPGPKPPEPPLPLGKRGSAKARRTGARLAAVQMAYQHLLAGTPYAAMLRDPIRYYGGDTAEGEEFVTPDVVLLKALLDAVEVRQADIDGLLTIALGPTRPLARVEQLLRAIMQVGAGELLTQPETAPAIVISDFVSIAEAFYGGPEVGLANAVLDRVKTELGPREAAAAS